MSLDREEEVLGTLSYSNLRLICWGQFALSERSDARWMLFLYFGDHGSTAPVDLAREFGKASARFSSRIPKAFFSNRWIDCVTGSFRLHFKASWKWWQLSCSNNEYQKFFSMVAKGFQQKSLHLVGLRVRNRFGRDVIRSIAYVTKKIGKDTWITFIKVRWNMVMFSRLWIGVPVP